MSKKENKTKTKQHIITNQVINSDGGDHQLKCNSLDSATLFCFGWKENKITERFLAEEETER